MSNSEFDKFFDGDWDDAGNLDWSEKDWNKFLKDIDQTVQKFILHYKGFKGHQDRLDQTATKMGWNSLDWDNAEADRQTDALLKAFENFVNDDEDDDFEEPLSVNKHPAFIAIEGLIKSLQFDWENFLVKVPNKTTTIDAVRYSRSLSKLELESILGVNALDLGDLTLAIAHLKRSLEELNNALSYITKMKHTEFVDESLAHLFDLRELWLRVINDCKMGHHQDDKDFMDMIQGEDDEDDFDNEFDRDRDEDDDDCPF
jgi:hypothetical protein